VRYLVHHLLEAAARDAPDRVAIVDGDRTILYGELELRANQLANLLMELGVRRGDRVAVYMNKSIEAVVAIYATLKTGAAYVPFDPLAPSARLGYIARNAGVRVLLTGSEREGEWGALVAERTTIASLVVLNAETARALPGVRLCTALEIGASSTRDPRVHAVEMDLAYILYTSGSTGAPKGVMLTHRNCLAFVGWAVDEFAVCAEDRLSSHAPLHFDLSTFDLFAAALAGATLLLVGPEISVFPAQLRSFIEAAEITVWYSVPSILTMLVTRGGLEVGDFPQLRLILFAGEVFPTNHLGNLMQLLPHVRFANLYGPTETNVCTWWEVASLVESASEAIPIGRPIANVDVFAVTDDGRLAETGETGELYVRGPTVMQGYVGDREKTASRLISNPFAGVVDELVYRTGDLVQQAPDGTFRFIGRQDAQIKSRGYRIELGDIEATLHDHPAVLECAVVAIPDELITNRLEAFVTTRDPVSKADLAAFCVQRLPQYMIPESFEFMDGLPRTSTGKIDRPTLAARAR
jgi:amino acid adenylation domain-containing protein